MKNGKDLVLRLAVCALGAGLLTSAALTSCTSSGGGGGAGGDAGSASGGAGGSSSGGASGGGSAGTGGTTGGNSGGAGSGGVAGTGGGAAGKAGGGASGGPAGGAGGGAAGASGSGGSLPVTNTATCAPPRLKFVRVAMAADSPMAIAQAKGDDRIFVAERAGIIRILRNGALVTAPFADFRSSVLVQGNDNTTERGLLNVVLHPKFPTDGRFYVFYTRKANDPLSTGAAGDVVIAEGKVSGMADKAEATLKVLTSVAHPEDFHIGGFLDFGPDGMLYAGFGDGGGGIDASGAGQDKTRRLAKILRIDVDNPTQKPAGNLDAPGADIHAWAYGVRNPFRGSFDRATGDLYFGDVGESSYEEIDWVPPGKTGLNFGWGYDPTQKVGEDQKQTGMEGLHPVPWFTAVEWAPFGYLPIHEYPHDGPGWQAAGFSYMRMGFSCGGGGSCAAAVVGGVVYRGAKASLYGRYFFGDNPRNKVSSFIVADGKATCIADLTSDLSTGQTLLQGLSGFGQDAAGEVYVLDLMGNIYRIDLE